MLPENLIDLLGAIDKFGVIRTTIPVNWVKQYFKEYLHPDSYAKQMECAEFIVGSNSQMFCNRKGRFFSKAFMQLVDPKITMVNDNQAEQSINMGVLFGLPGVDYLTEAQILRDHFLWMRDQVQHFYDVVYDGDEEWVRFHIADNKGEPYHKWIEALISKEFKEQAAEITSKLHDRVEHCPVWLSYMARCRAVRGAIGVHSWLTISDESLYGRDDTPRRHRALARIRKKHAEVEAGTRPKEDRGFNKPSPPPPEGSVSTVLDI